MPTADKPRRPVGRPPDKKLQQRRRGEILEAATELFAQRGFIETEVQEIADRAGVGKGTVYRYYPSKEELFQAALDHGMHLLNEAVAAAACDVEDPLERIDAGIRGYLEFFESHPNVVELLILERVHFRDRKRSTYFVHFDVNVLRWKEPFEQLEREGKLRDLPVKWMVEFVAEVVYGGMFTTHFSGTRSELSVDHAAFVDLIFRGILRCPDSSSG